MLALAMAGLATLPVVGHAATAVGWQKSLTEAFSAKTSVRAASTANLTLSGTQTVDGVVLAVGDRVLVKDQAIPAKNGIYIVSAGAWTRATDSDHWGKFIGANVIVTEGSANARSQWLSTALAGAGVLDTSSLTFAKLSGATTNSLAVLASNGIVVNNSGNIVARNLTAGSSRLSILNADGVAGNPTLDVVETNIAINNLNGTLSVSKGGTGATSLTTNGVLFGNGTGAVQVTLPGTSGQLLVANASGVPTFVSLSGDASLAASGAVTLANTGVVAGTYGSSTTAPVFAVDSKGRLTSASAVTITPAWANVTGKPTTVAGYGITDINAYAPTLTGGGASGTWGISITGNAATASKITSQGNVTAETGTVSPPTGLTMRQVYANGYPESYGNVLSMGGAGQSQLLLGWSGVSGAHEDNFIRSKRDVADATWSPWAKIMTDVNIGNYAPSLTGAGASGTWGISVTGNAATATQLATARTISMTGDGTWSTTFDGSANATGTLTLANTGVAAGTYGSPTMTTVYTVDSKGRIAGASNVTITPAWASVTGKPTTVAGYGITDINSYAPTLTGSGASGTWGINITGNAGSATVHSVTDSRSVVDTPESYNRGVYFDFKANTTNGLSDGGTYNGVMTFRQWGSSTDWSGGVAHQLGFTDSGDLWHRTGSGTAWAGWQEILDSTNVGAYAPSLTGVGASGTWGISVTGNAATATKLATARTISAAGDATWSATFDGSANATGTLTLANTGVTAGTYGSATTTPVYTVDSKGRITAASNVTITPAWANVSGKPTTVAGYGITDINSYAPTLTGGGASGTWGINVTGSAGSVSGLTLNSSSAPIAPDSVTQNQLGYANSVSLFGQTDGGLHSSAYSSSWIHQIFGDFRTGQIAVRGKNNGVWQGWRTVLDSGNATYAYNMNQNVRTTDTPTFAELYTNGWFRNNQAGTGMYNQATGRHIYSESSAYWRMTSDNGMRFYAGDNATLRGYVYHDSGGFGLLNGSGAWAVRANLSGSNAGGSLYGTWDAGNLTIGGNQVIHSGNIASYLGSNVMPLNGGVNANFDIASNSNTSAYYDAAMELRELKHGGAQTGALSEAPRLAFHWGSRVASQIALNTNNTIMIRDNPGTGYEKFAAGNITANGNLTATGNLTLSAAYPTLYTGGGYLTIPNGAYFSGGTVYVANQMQARGGVNNDSGNLVLSSTGGGTVVVNNQMQLAAVASSGAACGVAGAIARDGSNNVYICK